jgi:hypothetical protein
MKKLIVFSMLFSAAAPLFAATDYDAVVTSSFTTAQRDINYKIGYTPYENKPFFLMWKVPVSTQTPNIFVSTPDINALVNVYSSSTARTVLETRIQNFKTKFNMTDADLQTLEAILRRLR